MKYIDEFRDSSLTTNLIDRIRASVDRSRQYRFMEVCGTHTMAIFRFGLRDRLPANVRLISGPGCPVCVTPVWYMDRAIAIASLPGVIITTFGDILRVPGSQSTLERVRSDGKTIKTVYSTDDALDIARKNPDREVVFLGVGFETTSPTVAASIIAASRQGIDNYSVFSAHKTMPEALMGLMSGEDIGVDGFILPGHVCAITGIKPYGFIPRRYGKGCVVAGFEPVDILQAILMLIDQKSPRLEVQYMRIIGPSGNALARKAVETVFERCPSVWRGMGTINNSGLKIKKEFSAFDASLKFNVKVPRGREDRACICGCVLKGVKTPIECRLFGNRCIPDHPVGACMVSSEGTCAAYYKYGKR